MTLRPVALFDFDGTLADTIPLIVASFHQTLRDAGLPALDDDEIRSWIGRPLRPVFEERYPGRGDELTGAYRTWNLANHDALIRAVPQMPELLAALAARDVRTGVVSSKKTPTVEQGLRVVGLDTAIAVLAGMDDTTEHKPHPAPLLHAARQLGVAPHECVYVGDAVVDVEAAHSAGMASIAVTWGAGTRDALRASSPTAIVDDVPALLGALLTPERALLTQEG